MRSFILLSVLACVGCGPTPHCETTRGVLFLGDIIDGHWPDPEVWSCDFFQRTEDRLFGRIGEMHEASGIDTRRLAGTTVIMDRTARFADPLFFSQGLGGTTSRFITTSIRIGKPRAPHLSSYAHELVHAAQLRVTFEQDPDQDAHHADWTRHGLQRAISETLLQERHTCTTCEDTD